MLVTFSIKQMKIKWKLGICFCEKPLTCNLPGADILILILQNIMGLIEFAVISFTVLWAISF